MLVAFISRLETRQYLACGFVIWDNSKLLVDNPRINQSIDALLIEIGNELREEFSPITLLDARDSVIPMMPQIEKFSPDLIVNFSKAGRLVYDTANYPILNYDLDITRPEKIDGKTYTCPSARVSRNGKPLEEQYQEIIKLITNLRKKRKLKLAWLDDILSTGATAFLPLDYIKKELGDDFAENYLFVPLIKTRKTEFRDNDGSVIGYTKTFATLEIDPGEKNQDTYLIFDILKLSLRYNSKPEFLVRYFDRPRYVSRILTNMGSCIKKYLSKEWQNEKLYEGDKKCK